MITSLKPFAFVLMPFDDGFNDIYKLGIKQTAEEKGVIAERVDEQHFSETILERVYRQIENCDFVIAEMSGQNPNVFYEVGYAHAKNKLCTLITRDAADIPFDLKHHPHVVYDGTISDLKSKLGPKLDWLIAETRKQKDQSIVVSAKSGSGNLEKEEYRHVGSFTLTLDLKNMTDRRSPEIDAIYIRASKEWSLSCQSNPCSSNLDESDSAIKISLVSPSLKRLASSAFFQEKIEFKRTFWTKWSGEEPQEEYKAQGSLVVDVVTSEGTLNYNLPLEVIFEEFPF
ncbi:nucleoside 2-deoxyribosyltransferase [Thalassospira lucentensis]|uniref:nucleoside 2-deoxyribosyltransferase n=1 Tax=Thalassospira lucentensis TaxID=168935 RepID=UPI00399D5734